MAILELWHILIMPQKLPTRLLSRGLSFARATLKAGQFAAGGSLKNIEAIVKELSQLKGTAMKVGQTLSLYGETLFPKEINDLLKNLQAQAEPLPWSEMEKVLRRELGERFHQLEIDPKSIASASIGQVYRARLKETGEELALKVQYPGVDLAVESDMKFFKVLLGLPGVFPGGLKLDNVLAEVKDMFYQELDYRIERQHIEAFREYLSGDSRYIVPKTYPEFSTAKVLALEFMNGVRADAPEVLRLSQERRDRIGQAYFELYLRELLDIKKVQTDPHLGNYLVKVDDQGNDQRSDQLILFDFGAVRAVPEEFLEAYQHLMHGGLTKSAREIEYGGRKIGLLKPEDSLDLVDDYVNLCLLLTEPFNDETTYAWNESDLPKRVASQVGKVAFSYKLRAPPRELVFLDRKLSGVFIFMSVLKCRWSGRRAVFNALEKYRGIKE